MQMKKDENEKKVASFLKGCEKKELNKFLFHKIYPNG